jgi:hypothetical protein
MIFIINKNLTVECEYYETRYSWGHKAYLYRDGKQIDYKKIVYQNRTWESYQFQSILQCLAGSKNNGLDQKEKDLFSKRINSNWADDSRKKVEQEFKTISMIASLGDIFGSNQKESNDWKARMIKAGLGDRGLIMPEDWDDLSEDVKESRLNAVITNLK